MKPESQIHFTFSPVPLSKDRDWLTPQQLDDSLAALMKTNPIAASEPHLCGFPSLSPIARTAWQLGVAALHQLVSPVSRPLLRKEKNSR
jgi:hypothetical protein